MKAIIQTRYGSPNDLDVRDVPPPTAGAGELLVRVRAASVHPDVWHMVTGRPYALRLMGGGFVKPKHPIPGTDLAGVVEAVGAGVTRFRPGNHVFGDALDTHQWTNGGTYAEYVSVRQDLVVSKPDNVTFAQAASVPTSGHIALQNFREGPRLRPGQRVLVNGAGGGVGSIVVQLAKAYGAHVTGVDGPRKLDMLRTLGADVVVDYTKDNFTEMGVRYSIVFDIPGNYPFAACRRALEPDGRYIPIGHEDYGRAGNRMFGMLPSFVRLMLLSRFVKQLRGPKIPLPTRAESLETLRTLLASGKLTPIVDSTYPLAEFRQAFRRLTDGEAQGKVVLVP